MSRPLTRDLADQNGTVPAIGQGPFRRFQDVCRESVVKPAANSF